jgi:hypothetical protein
MVVLTCAAGLSLGPWNGAVGIVRQVIDVHQAVWLLVKVAVDVPKELVVRLALDHAAGVARISHALLVDSVARLYGVDAAKGVDHEHQSPVLHGRRLTSRLHGADDLFLPSLGGEDPVLNRLVQVLLSYDCTVQAGTLLVLGVHVDAHGVQGVEPGLDNAHRKGRLAGFLHASDAHDAAHRVAVLVDQPPVCQVVAWNAPDLVSQFRTQADIAA